MRTTGEKTHTTAISPPRAYEMHAIVNNTIELMAAVWSSIEPDRVLKGWRHMAPTLTRFPAAGNAGANEICRPCGIAPALQLTESGVQDMMPSMKRGGHWGRLAWEFAAASVSPLLRHSLGSEQIPSTPDCRNRLTIYDDGDSQFIALSAFPQSAFFGCGAHSSPSVRPVCAEFSDPVAEFDRMARPRAPP